MHPRKWPVRWRIAATSAGLTLVILLIFGIGIGEVASERIRSDFNHEVKGAAQTLAAETTIAHTPTGALLLARPDLNDFAKPNDATARIFDSSGRLLESNSNGTNLGPLRAGLTSAHGMRVAVYPITSSGVVTGYAQYGRSLEHIDSTIDRLWLLVGGGVLIGTVLASFAGAAIARRAMRPISSLTATARAIAATGDPSRHMPEPQADDEVGELGRTLEQMLRSLDAARAEREEAMAKQREFVADASHELRTPLTSILANLELLQASLHRPEHEDDRAMVDSALRSSGRMSRLVSDLLLLARADAGRSGSRSSCDLAEIAGAAAVEVAPMMGGRELLVDNERALPVQGNSDELHRMVLNLLDNAARHTPPDATIELRLRREGEEAVVEVADDGPGIPVDLRDAIFDRFVRGEGPADTAAGGGSGLGLAIVRAVADSHRGTATATESERGGALFEVHIPLDLTEARAKGAVKGSLPAA